MSFHSRLRVGFPRLAYSAIVIAFLAGVGCRAGVSGPDGPAVMPNEGRLGDPACNPCRGTTVGITVDSNYVPTLEFLLEDYGLARNDVQIRLSDSAAPGGFRLIAPRAVFSASLFPASPRALSSPGAWSTVVVFDLPNRAEVTLPTAYPVATSMTLEIRGAPNANLAVPFTITGVGGTPSSFDPALTELESQPLLRLRAKAGTPPAAFDTAWIIGGMEFELEYPAAVAQPRALPATEAAAATAYVHPLSAGRARVVLVDPKGFRLGPPQGGFTAGRAGEGPFLDIAFVRTGAFAVNDFTIRKLLVTDRDGAPLLDRRSAANGGESTSVFILTAAGNHD